jgi:hypothetical protein
MAAAPAAEFLELQALGGLLLVLRRDVVPALAFGARQGDVVSHNQISNNAGADDRDRTGDLVLTKDVLCQLSYIGLPAPGRLRPGAKPTLERETGIEPATNSLEGCDSTTELLPPIQLVNWRIGDAVNAARAACHLPITNSPTHSFLPLRQMVAREGLEPSKPLGRQIYSLLRLTASLPRRYVVLDKKRLPLRRLSRRSAVARKRKKAGEGI